MGKYSNPWPSFTGLILKTLFTSVKIDFKSSPDSVYPTKILTPDFGQTQVDLRVMWIGHATVYVQYRHADQMLGILFDPIWSKRSVRSVTMLNLRCSPCPLLGPKRGLNAPCQVSDLPVVNLIVISHDHYDHLDKRTVQDIERFHPDVHYFVPTGLKKVLSRSGVSTDRITELGWWEEAGHELCRKGPCKEGLKVFEDVQPNKNLVVSVEKTVEVFEQPISTINSSSATLVERIDKGRLRSPSSSSGSTLIDGDDSGYDSGSSIKIICTPAQHNSGRSLLSQNKTLWASWVIELPRPRQEPWKIFFGGDTGYRSNPGGPVCPIFQEIRQQYGAPDLALLPIAAGSVLPFLEKLLPVQLDHHRLTSSIHCSPEDAVQISQLMGASKSVGIHWGTFTTPAHASQTVKELQRWRKEWDVGEDWGGNGGFCVANIGEWLNVSVPEAKRSQRLPR